MNGVLNADNTSILGLSIDFGSFAFLASFNPTYIPNHDDSCSATPTATGQPSPGRTLSISAKR